MKELHGLQISDNQIRRVDTGCIEFFFHEVFEIAKDVGTLLKDAAELIITVRSVRTLWKQMKQFKIPNSDDTAAKNHEKALIEEKINSIVTEITTSSTVEKGRLNELNTALRKSITAILKSFDEGVKAEIKAPYLNNEEDAKKELANEPEKLNNFLEKENEKRKILP